MRILLTVLWWNLPSINKATKITLIFLFHHIQTKKTMMSISGKEKSSKGGGMSPFDD